MSQRARLARPITRRRNPPQGHTYRRSGTGAAEEDDMDEQRPKTCERCGGAAIGRYCSHYCEIQASIRTDPACLGCGRLAPLVDGPFCARCSDTPGLGER